MGAWGQVNNRLTRQANENGNQADRKMQKQARKTCNNTDKQWNIKRDIKASRAMEDWVQAWVWCGGLSWLESEWCGVELSMLVNESSEGGYSVEFPCGTAAAEGRKNPLHSEGKKEREIDKGRGSEGKCGRWLRATNHMVMEKGGRNYSSEHVESHTAITGLTVCFPHGCYSAGITPSGTIRTKNSLAVTNRAQREDGDRGQPQAKLTRKWLKKKKKLFIYPSSVDTSGYHEG